MNCHIATNINIHARKLMSEYDWKFRIATTFTWRGAGLDRIFVPVLGALFEVMFQFSRIFTIGNSIIL
jgi:hypothetical protein